jgi:hypothetical protein
LVRESEEWFYVYHDLALTFQATGQMEQAESDYRETEKALDIEGKSLKQRYSKEFVPRKQAEVNGRLGKTLEEHAALLRQMGHKADADDLEQRAKSLVKND